MHLHFLGICGTFMGSLAMLARELGHTVTGSDANVYPPMSTQLQQQGIVITEGYDPAQLQPAPDLVIVGNAMSRGNPAVEYLLDAGLPYTSGPQWLCEHVLQGRWVLAVAGTHGKTTTSSMLAWILDYAGMAPGFLIGGVPQCFPVSARLGGSDFFVIEADEYDCAFFDKRSKFVHYRPRTAILNNLEFDHADIFDDLAAIQKQFHHLVRTIPQNGLVISPADCAALDEVLAMGCWTPTQKIGADGAWAAQKITADGSHFSVQFEAEKAGEVRWAHSGDHNVNNALAAIAAARHVGVAPDIACAALSAFSGVKRRLELLCDVNGVRVYDDFAHHPTAIATTVSGLRKRIGGEKLIAVLEPRSNTMRMGVFREQIAPALVEADEVIFYQPANVDWALTDVAAQCRVSARVVNDIDQLVRELSTSTGNTHILIMSNGGFGGLHQKLVAELNAG
ncbi:MAG: UDP-N-acetylmuramate:L-alanyl-gamma-D-glutamyl-meso-diaminopimelate ligase [Cellvibrionales bacterium]|jgi:UDP-N-acetylmuramate: L-alanyl-gamma-D-glutamyl-meso-diaminopimelate ligase|nr:UDP-N-acetylmuramate:L-alanyl-gamma-D-glutamyl-meso-diaminopimelate ligase [Cellvibrionales bacterium]MBK8676459.1 UDP-N-acetylmuramate:L-alanyl-gamma-D-glutamyl-meso-diaminopimelate ligase [Cellvibrionales bacterium]